MVNQSVKCYLHNIPSIQIPFSHLAAISALPTAHHEEVCDYYEQRRELPLPVYHNFKPLFTDGFLAFITAQYINPPSTPPTVL